MATVRVTAYGRVKPCPPQAVSQDISLEIGPKECRVVFTDHGLKPERFKKIFDEHSTQAEIFDAVGRPLIENTLKGYNSTMLSYGQTGTGKTYTMTGEFHDPEYHGLIPRTIEEIFSNMEVATEITITYFEIYNEHVYDLIKNDEQSEFEISDTGPLSNNLGLAFRSLSRYKVNTVDQAMALLLQGDSKKMIAQTCSNERSSRSHTIFAIGLKFPHPNGGGTFLNPVLLLVDLAGSENLSKHKGSHNFFETRYINLSLHYLEQVLLALRRPNRIHVPYRNSLMTTFLKNSLGGSCITAVIATFSLAEDNIQETRQTCRFAVNVAYIKNELKVTEETQYAKKLEDLEREVESLRAQLHLLTREESAKPLTTEDKEACVKEVQNFIREGFSMTLPLKDSKKVKFCFHLLRKKILMMSQGKNHFELKCQYSQGSLENGREKTTEITVEKNWRNQKHPMELPKVNITYEKFGQTEEVTEKESLPFEKRKIVKIIKSESTLIEKISDKKLLSRVSFDLSKNECCCKTVSQTSTEANENDEPGSYSGAKTSSFDSESSPVVQDEESEESAKDPNLAVENVSRTIVEREPAEPSDDQEGQSGCSNESGKNYQNPVKGLPLTGDEDIDEEIIKFYKCRYEHFKDK